MYPVLDEIKKVSKKYKKIIVIEMNDGQYKQEIERLLKREIESIPVLGGEIHLSEIKKQLK